MTNRNNTAIDYLRLKMEKLVVTRFTLARKPALDFHPAPCLRRAANISGLSTNGRTDHLSDGNLRLGRGVNNAVRQASPLATSF